MEILLLDNRDVSNGQESMVAWPAIFQQYRCLRPERVLSTGAARNLLAGHAGGDYLLTIDADSILAPFALEKLSAMAGAYGDRCRLLPGTRARYKRNNHESRRYLRTGAYPRRPKC